MESNTSDFATGAVLLMLCEDEKWHPCAFLSKGLNDVKRSYDVHDKEMLGIIRALEAWRHYLEGAKHEIDIWTDHQNLKYFMTAKKLNCRQAMWCMSEGESLSRDASREVNAKPYSKRALDRYFRGFYYGITGSSKLWDNTCCVTDSQNKLISFLLQRRRIL